MTNDPSKINGQYNVAMGSTKEGLGKIVQSENLRVTGQQQQQAGQNEIDAARAQGHKEGTQDRLEGSKDSTLGGVTGDKQQKAQGDAQRDKGSVQLDLNRSS